LLLASLCFCAGPRPVLAKHAKRRPAAKIDPKTLAQAAAGRVGAEAGTCNSPDAAGTGLALGAMQGWAQAPLELPGQGDPEVERFRKRIINRESGGNYRIADRKERWFGAYQFSLQTSNEAARRMRRLDLVGVPANRWADEDQDAAFYLIYNKGRGKQHWRTAKRRKA
jgi:hypothetical protein